MEKLIFLFLLGVGSMLVNWYQQKQKRDAEKQDLDRASQERMRGGRAAPPTPQAPPQSLPHWAEELRRLLDPNAQQPPQLPRIPPVVQRTQPPPIVTTRRAPQPPPIVTEISEGEVTFQSPLKQSASAYQQAASLQQKVETRMKTIDEQTTKHPKLSVIARRKTRSASELTRAWKANPQSLREALLASIILGKPQSL